MAAREAEEEDGLGQARQARRERKPLSRDFYVPAHYDASITEPEDEQGRSPLMAALAEGDKQKAKRCISKVRNINHKDFEGRTALHYATEIGYRNITNSLLKAGADINCRDLQLRTPLMCSAKCNRAGIAELLINNGADIEAQDVCGQTALFYVDWQLGNVFVNLLLSRGADVNHSSKEGDTPFFLAVENNALSVVKKFVLNGANINKCDFFGNSALIKACRKNHVDIVKYLLFQCVDCDPNIKNKRGVSALTSTSNRKLKHLLIRRGAIDSSLSVQHGASEQENTGHEVIRLPLTVFVAQAAITMLSTAPVADAQRGCHCTLLKTAMLGDINSIYDLLTDGEDVNVRCTHGNTPLLKAAMKGNEKAAAFLLIYEADVNAQNVKGESALMSAVMNRNLSLVKQLLSKDADVNLRDRSGRTALNFCEVREHPEIMNCLIKAKLCQDLQWTESTLLSVAKDCGSCFTRAQSQISIDDIDNNTLAKIALLAEHQIIIDMLLKKMKKKRTNLASLLFFQIQKSIGVECKEICNQHETEERTLLMVAVYKNNHQVLSFLLDMKVDVNRTDTEGWTALMYCSQNGFVACMERLINHGAEIERKCNTGDTALAISAANGHKNAVLFLPEKGAKIDCKNSNGFTPLILASYNGCLAVVKCLLCNDADWSCKTITEHDTALHIACKREEPEIALALISQMRDLNAKNLKTQTALHICSSQGQASMVDRLIHSGASLDITDRYGNTALILGASQNHYDVEKILIEAGAQTNIRNKQNKTALVVAAEAGFQQSVGVLLQKGKHSLAEIEEAKQAAYKCNQFRAADLISQFLNRPAGPPTFSEGLKNVSTGERRPSDDYLSQAEAVDAQGETEDTNAEVVLSGRRLEVLVENCSEQFFYDNREDAYCMENKPRGLALIVNVYSVRGESPRAGTNVDRDNLKQLFTQLNFNVIVYNDENGLTANEIKTKVRRFSTDPVHMTMDASIICLLSHGEEGYIFGTDGERVNLSEIYNMFDNKNCRALVDKPKIFFVQACRGDWLDDGVPCDEEDAVKEPQKVPSTSDMLKCFPTQEFYTAFRNTAHGSWFIEAIVQVFMKYSKSEDVCTMMHRVNDIVSKRVSTHGKVQISEFVSTLRKPRLYFFPGIPSTTNNQNINELNEHRRAALH